MKTKPTPHARSSRFLDNEQLNQVSRKLCDDIEGLFDALGLDPPNLGGKCIKMACPVHGGDNKSACNIYPEGDEIPGRWVCQTAGCHKIYKATIIGFVRGVISYKKGKDITFGEAVDWCQKFLNQDLSLLEVDYAAAEKRKFAAVTKLMNGEEEVTPTSKITRTMVRKHLEIPSRAMLDRGFSREILSKYDIGESHKSEMAGRIVTPCYDDDYKFLVGCVGRSLSPKCSRCGFYHDDETECPSNSLEEYHCAKHRNSKGFQAEKTLFNYWFARRYIYETKVAILVESAGNVMRLEEAGIHNGLGMFGTALKDAQRVKLDKSGAMAVVLVLDNDEPGRKARESLEKELRRSYRVEHLHVPVTRNDVAETPVEDIRDLFVPKLEKLYREISCD